MKTNKALEHAKTTHCKKRPCPMFNGVTCTRKGGFCEEFERTQQDAENWQSLNKRANRHNIRLGELVEQAKHYQRQIN